MKKPLIIWMIDSLGHGGAEKLTFTIIRNFDVNLFDFRVCVLQERHGNPIEKELKRINIPVDMVPIPYLRHPFNLPKILSYLSVHKPQILHTQLEFSDVLGNISASILGIPSFSTVHTIEDLTPNDGREFWREKLVWFCLKTFSRKIIAVSENAKRFYSEKWGVPEIKFITLYNGIDLSGFNQSNEIDANAKKQSLNLPSNCITFTTVAVLREPKGIQYMLQALPEIIKRVPNFYYLIVGDGEYGTTLKELTKSLGMEKHVVFTGQRNDINEILSVSDVFLLPTLTEALPTVLIEAMAAQKAIIASEVGGVPEMVTNGINGLLISPANVPQLIEACLQLAQNKKLRDEMGKQGRKVAFQKFDINIQVRELKNLYEKAIKNER